VCQRDESLIGKLEQESVGAHPTMTGLGYRVGEVPMRHELTETAGSDGSLKALMIGFLALIATVIGAMVLLERQQQAEELVTHTLKVENGISAVMSKLQDAETGQRGYLLTGHSEFLEPYDRAMSELPRDIDLVRRLTADNPRQQQALDRFQEIVNARQDVLRGVLATYRRGGGIEVGRLRIGKQLMDQARQQVALMKAEEQHLLDQRAGAAGQRANSLVFLLGCSAALSIVLAGFALVAARRRITQVSETNALLGRSNAQLREEAETRQSAELQVRQLQKMEAVGQLTGGIAHDFNNMLTIVIGSLETAKRRFDDHEKVRDCINNAIEGAQRAAQLTSRLLAFSRRQPLEPSTLDINKLVGGMSELLRRTIGEHLRMETVLSGGLWRVFIDPNQLENAVLNLCVNARDAMPSGGKLTIETANAHLDDRYSRENPESKPGQYVMLSVTDTGIGMPDEVVEHAFEPFFTTKGMGQGTGLGLSQVHGFVKQSGGHIKIYSEASVGTTVKMYLPRYLGEETALQSEREVAAVPHARDHEIVLVVEDDDGVRHLSVDYLRELGYTVVQAADAGQALAVLSLQPRVDLLFTDVVMPDVDGRKLAEQARRERPDLKVLYTTGYTQNAIVHNGMLDQGVALLSKPFTLETLARKVREVLDA
jgi:signal transduction histidine kinase/CheY-like chemotaxis protein